MKRYLMAIALALAAFPALAQVGVSINLGAPDFYGQIYLGDAPRPALVYPQPIIAMPAPQYVAAAPIYLRVPPGHARNWRKHCARYHACGRPVYFVQDSWYRGQYMPYYRVYHRDYQRRGKHANKHRYSDRHRDRKHVKHGDRHGSGGWRGHDRD